MSENREDDAQEGGARIEDLPASDSELAGEKPESRRGAPPNGDPDARSSPPPPDEARSSPPPDPGE
jgi:hypothetical protein